MGGEHSRSSTPFLPTWFTPASCCRRPAIAIGRPPVLRYFLYSTVVRTIIVCYNVFSRPRVSCADTSCFISAESDRRCSRSLLSVTFSSRAEHTSIDFVVADRSFRKVFFARCVVAYVCHQKPVIVPTTRRVFVVSYFSISCDVSRRDCRRVKTLPCKLFWPFT